MATDESATKTADGVEGDPVLPLTIYGPEVSYFTGKLESVIRFMELPYRRIPKPPTGQLARATGVAQVAEVFWQLRGEADTTERQVPGAKVGIAHTMGGAVSGADGACSMQVLKI